MASRPVVLETTDVHAFLQYVLDHHATTSTIVVCSSKKDFIQSLQPSPSHASPEAEADAYATREQNQVLHALSRPTLRQLASLRTLTLAFCSDVVQLRAYLATYHVRKTASSFQNSQPSEQDSRTPILGLLNPIELHKPTSAFSAQGLNRTFAVAVDAARQTSSRLVIAECAPHCPAPTEEHGNHDETTEASSTASATDPWNFDVSMLNVATKTFGAGERGWVGRTVKLRTIAARWATFEPSASEQPS